MRIAAELLEAPALKDELANFRRNVTSAGRQSFGARVGQHDDLLLATSLCVWWIAYRKKRGTSVGTVKGLF